MTKVLELQDMEAIPNESGDISYKFLNSLCNIMRYEYPVNRTGWYPTEVAEEIFLELSTYIDALVNEKVVFNHSLIKINFAGRRCVLYPDWVLCFEEDQMYKTKVVFVNKKFPLKPSDLRCDIASMSDAFNDAKKVKAPFTQIINHMFASSCAYGVIADSQTAFLIEIDLEAFETMDPGYLSKNVIPIKSRMLNFRDPKEPFLLFASNFLWDAVIKGHGKSQKMEDLNIADCYLKETRVGSSTSSESIDNFYPMLATTARQNPEASQRFMNEYLHTFQPYVDELSSFSAGEELPVVTIDSSQVNFQSEEYGSTCHEMFTIKAWMVSKFIRQTIDPQETIMVKLFDALLSKRLWRSERKVPPQGLATELEFCYENERRAIQILFNPPYINNCYLDHEEFEISLWIRNYELRGKCILSKFIETKEIPTDEETYQQAKHQLSLIHRHRIVHGDVAFRNMLYDNEGKIYFIDFGSCMGYFWEPDVKQDYDRLRLYFEGIMKD